MVSESAEGGGDFLVAGVAEESDGGVAEGGEVLRGVALLDLAFILAKGHVANPMQAIFDSPMPSPNVAQLSGVSAWAGCAGNGVLHFLSGFAALLGRAFQPTDLAQAGPIKILGQSRAGLEMPRDDAAVRFFDRA